MHNFICRGKPAYLAGAEEQGFGSDKGQCLCVCRVGRADSHPS